MSAWSCLSRSFLTLALVATLAGCGGNGSSPAAAAPDGGTDAGNNTNPCGNPCQSLVTCGPLPDGCGKIVDCGSACPTGQTCGGGGVTGLCGDAASNLIPADRRTLWNPGLNAVGGIPKRTNVVATLSPSPSGDDTDAIKAALDACPPEGVVQLTAGTFNIKGNGLVFKASNCTLRGAGTGMPGTGAGGTRLVKADRDQNILYGVLYLGDDSGAIASSTDLARDAIKGETSITLASDPGVSVGEIVLIDEITWDKGQPTGGFEGAWWGTNHDTGTTTDNNGSRRWFCRQDRSISQLMEVTAVNGTTVSFSTPFHISFKTAHSAQLSRFQEPFVRRSGVEDLYVYGGMGGDTHGNIPVQHCAYCWVKNVESHWSVGTSIGLYGTFRSEVRDSYIHETPDPNPGGSGYLSGINNGASDNLFENNIMWYGNKVVVMRASGGGNVFAYNYTDDSFGSGFPDQPEAGINAGHYTTPHMELLEGNYSPNFKGDSFWGNSIYITVFRNHLSGLRRGAPPLDKYTYDDGQGHVYPYMDLHNRAAVDIQDHSYGQNVVGNVLGLANQKLLSYGGAENFAQTAFIYEKLGPDDDDALVSMWKVGELQCDHSNYCAPWNTKFVTDDSLLRDGNWDFATQSQRWHGIGGAAGAGKPTKILDSLYLTQKPWFFGTTPWPWVDPSTGTVSTLPAKARFDAMPGH